MVRIQSRDGERPPPGVPRWGGGLLHSEASQRGARVPTEHGGIPSPAPPAALQTNTRRGSRQPPASPSWSAAPRHPEFSAAFLCQPVFSTMVQFQGVSLRVPSPRRQLLLVSLVSLLLAKGQRAKTTTKSDERCRRLMGPTPRPGQAGEEGAAGITHVPKRFG